MAAALFIAFATCPVSAEEVDLELILMVDVSGSIDDAEFTLQRMGYVSAFRNPRVASAIRNGPLGKIAISFVEWTGPTLYRPIVDWMVLSDRSSVLGFAEQLEKKPRALFGGGTGVGSALVYAGQSVETNAFTSKRRVVDISGDGTTNRGVPASMARDALVARGFTINGLPILTDDPTLDRYYLTEVIGGPGAFIVAAQDFEDFATAILAKLIREIASTEGSPRNRLAER